MFVSNMHQLQKSLGYPPVIHESKVCCCCGIRRGTVRKTETDKYCDICAKELVLLQTYPEDFIAGLILSIDAKINAFIDKTIHEAWVNIVEADSIKVNIQVLKHFTLKYLRDSQIK